MKATLYVFECKSGKHRIARKSEKNAATCSRCERTAEFSMVAKVDQEDDESEAQHLIRALGTRKKRVN